MSSPETVEVALIGERLATKAVVEVESAVVGRSTALARSDVKWLEAVWLASDSTTPGDMTIS